MCSQCGGGFGSLFSQGLHLLLDEIVEELHKAVPTRLHTSRRTAGVPLRMYPLGPPYLGRGPLVG